MKKHGLGRQFTSAIQPKRLKSGDAVVEGEGKYHDLAPEDVPMDVARASEDEDPLTRRCTCACGEDACTAIQQEFDE
jgi:hypothetical protein